MNTANKKAVTGLLSLKRSVTLPTASSTSTSQQQQQQPPQTQVRQENTVVSSPTEGVLMNKSPSTPAGLTRAITSDSYHTNNQSSNINQSIPMPPIDMDNSLSTAINSTATAVLPQLIGNEKTLTTTTTTTTTKKATEKSGNRNNTSSSHSSTQTTHSAEIQNAWDCTGDFIKTTYLMIEDCDTNHPEIASWFENGNKIVIYDKERLLAEILPKYFSCNYFSFIRQLNFWGFKKIQSQPLRRPMDEGPSLTTAPSTSNTQSPNGNNINNKTNLVNKNKMSVFVNDNFKKGRFDLLCLIKRSTNQMSKSSTNFDELQKEVDALKSRNCDLKQGMERLRKQFEDEITYMKATYERRIGMLWDFCKQAKLQDRGAGEGGHDMVVEGFVNPNHQHHSNPAASSSAFTVEVPSLATGKNCDNTSGVLNNNNALVAEAKALEKKEVSSSSEGKDLNTSSDDSSQANKQRDTSESNSNNNSVLKKRKSPFQQNDSTSAEAHQLHTQDTSTSVNKRKMTSVSSS